MRHPRLTAAGRAEPWPAVPGAPPPLVAVAHGSRDPRAAATVNELLTAVRALSPRLDVRGAFLDHCAPALAQVLGSVRGRVDGTVDGTVDGPVDGTAACVVVPLLLTAAYHSKADIPAQLAAAAAARPGQEVILSGTLGPHPLLTAALERRLREAGVPVDDAAARAATSVVLAAAGSSDPAANAAIAALASRWARERGWRAVVPACASAVGPRPAEAVAALRDCGPGPVVVASYLLAPGYFADKVRSASLDAGAAAVSAALGAAPEVAEVVLDRYAAAAAGLSAREAGAAGADQEPARAQRGR